MFVVAAKMGAYWKYDSKKEINKVQLKIKVNIEEKPVYWFASTKLRVINVTREHLSSSAKESKLEQQLQVEDETKWSGSNQVESLCENQWIVADGHLL